MPDLPGSSIEQDKNLFTQFLYSPDLQVDQWKIYPCETIEYTKIKEWFIAGKYKHYSNEDLIALLIWVKLQIHPRIRINRIIRDITTVYKYESAGIKKPHTRNILKELINAGAASKGNSEYYMKQLYDDRFSGVYSLAKRGKYADSPTCIKIECKCIRCREVKNDDIGLQAISNAKMIIRPFDASYGKEYFISMESVVKNDKSDIGDKTYLYGFCRLRLSSNAGYVADIKPRVRRKTKSDFIIVNKLCLPVLKDCACIRELHVYGKMIPVDYETSDHHSQHTGFGKLMIAKAEEIATLHGYTKMAIISGIGVRKYYMKLGYHLKDTYMIKNIKKIKKIKKITVNTIGLYILSSLKICLFIIMIMIIGLLIIFDR